MAFQVVGGVEAGIDTELLAKFDRMSEEQKDDFEAMLDELLNEKKTNHFVKLHVPMSREAPA